MNEQEQRIAIAEFCGWRPTGYGSWYIGNKEDMNHAVCDGSHNHIQLPDYCNDLNAMHEAEKMLDVELYATYAHKLSTINEIVPINIWYDHHALEVHAVATSTAAQRAESLLRTIGKWKD